MGHRPILNSLTDIHNAPFRKYFQRIAVDNQNRVIAYEELFHGTIDSASVYPREVVKTALKANTSAVSFAHNHPSPSEADKRITKRLCLN